MSDNVFGRRRRWPLWLTLLAVLLALGVAWSYFHNYGFHRAPWLHESYWFGTSTTEVADAKPRSSNHFSDLRRQPRLDASTAETPEMLAGKDCLRQQAELLAKGRQESLDKARDLVSKWGRGRKADADAFVAYVIAHPDGDVVDAAPLGDVVEWSITLPSGGKIHFADERHVCICHTWQFTYTAPPSPPKPKVVERRVNCFAYHMDGRGYPVTGKVTLELYQHGGRRDDVGRALNSGCFYAVDDETGRKIYLTPTCDGCDGMVQEVWPLDVYVGAQATYTGTFVCPSKHCTVYLPAFWAAETSTLWCFTTTSPYGSPGWTQYKVFDRTTAQAARSAVPHGSFSRVIRPLNAIGDPDQVVGLRPPE